MSKSQTWCTSLRNSNKPVWRRESAKSVITNFEKPKPQESVPTTHNETITNLVADLAVAINGKIKLENENALLKVELQDCKDKICTLEKKCTDEMRSSSETIARLQNECKETMIKLKEKEHLHCEREKEHLININHMTDTYHKEKGLAMARENDLKNELGELRHQLEIVKLQLKDISHQSNCSKEKTAMYKEKLKFCVDLITKLNSFLNEVQIGKSIIDQCCQTDERESYGSKPLCAYSGCSLECENMVLSELFFKENPFNDSIEELF